MLKFCCQIILRENSAKEIGCGPIFSALVNVPLESQLHPVVSATNVQEHYIYFKS